MAITSLFGPTPAEIIAAQQQQMQQEQLLRNQQIAQQGAEFGPFRGLYQAALRFGDIGSQAVTQGLFPQQMDPRLQQATAIQSVISRYSDQDFTNPDVLSSMSKDFAQIGRPQQAILLAQEASKYKVLQQDLATKQAAVRKAELSEKQELQLRQELAELGPNATEDQVLGVVTKYGTPDKILAALSASQSRQAQREQQRELAQMRIDNQREIAQSRLDIQREGLQLRKDIQDTKIAEKSEKQQAAAEGAISNAGRVIETVTEAKKLVSPWSTGVGGYLSVLPSTDARKLKNKIDTIKANLGFDRLQQMRDASPTGGALGQVAVQEINFLQATVATLDQLESTDDLRAALNKIEEHYSNWKSALEGRLPGGAPQGATATPQAIPPGVTVKRKN